MNDLVYVSYDNDEARDEKALCVGRPNADGSLTVLNEFLGDEAERMYEDIVNPSKRTNFAVIRGMSEGELAQFLEDLEKFDDPNHEWKSELMPILPFEDWSSWLNREANYGKKETDKKRICAQFQQLLFSRSR
ncbi:MAG: hypothetical protein IJ819_00305 [Clostridiales bacterium]|nr:hypothetical protein [Clostridiales bacterium]